MKLKSRASVVEAANAQVPASDYVPYGGHVRPDVIKVKGGHYLAMWRVDGYSFETADPADVIARKEALNNLVRSLGGGRFALWTHRIRRRVNERLDGQFNNQFAQDFSERYNARFKSRSQMRTEWYLSVIYRGETAIGSMFKRIGAAKTFQQKLLEEAGRLEELEEGARQVEASLSRYGVHRLGVTASPSGRAISEMSTVLGFLVNGVWEPMPLARATVDDLLPVSRILFGDTNGMAEICHPSVGKKFVGFLDFKEYPADSQPGMCNSILYGDYEFIETHSFSVLSRRDALEELKRQHGQLEASEDVAKTQLTKMKEAENELADGQFEMGEYHYTLAVFGQTLEAASKNMAEARAALSDDTGFTMAVVDAVPEAAWFAQLPGNWWLRPREAKLTSRNFVALSPFHNFAAGKRDGNPWGSALALMETPSGQPYYLNFHVSPEDEDSADRKLPGNTFICGSTGSGKTALAMALLAFATKYQGFRAVAFDKDRGMEIAIRRMGGQYYPLRRGEPTGFNPFQRPPTEANVDFGVKLVTKLIVGTGAPLSVMEQEAVSQAVRTTMSDAIPVGMRRLSGVWQQLPNVGGNPLSARLKRWIAGEPLGWVFDNPRDLQSFEGATLFGYDYTEFLDDPEVRTPIMAYLLHVTETLLDGRPFWYLMDEFWKPLMDPDFTGFARDKQKTIRKQNGLGLFITQSPGDVVDHEIGRTMVEQCVTQIYLPNPRADRRDYVDGFKVSESEFRIITSLSETSRMFLVKQGQSSAVVRFDLSGLGQDIDVLSGSTDSVLLLDEIRGVVGNDPEDWAPVLHAKLAERRAAKK